MKYRISLNKVIERIEQADDHELGEIMKAVVRRYGCISPGWEVVFLSLPKNNPEERNRQLELVADFLRKHSPNV